MADVNFTEKTPFYYSDFNETDVSVVTPIYLNYTDANGITLSSSKNVLTAGSRPTETELKAGRWWFDSSCTIGNDSYNTNYFQVSSARHAIKQLSVRLSAAKVQVVLVGWKGTVNGNADYCRTDTYEKITTSEYRWIEYNLSEWEDVRTIRFYANFSSKSDLTVNGEKIETTSITKGSYNIYGIQVGLDTENVSTSITSYGVAAFSSGNYLDFTNVTECSAFYADSYANGVLHLTKATGVVPPHFGLLLSSTDEGAVSFSIPIATEEQVANCTLTTKSNKFVATDQATYTPTTSTKALALGVKGGTVGFYYVGEGVTVPQYRFYLPAPSVGEAKNLTLDFGNTAISSIPFEAPATQNSVEESAIPSQTSHPTDLLGRPCPTPRAGALYIKGGKAYLTPTR